jgi:DnaJ-domain-containing protein 1
MTKAKKQGDKIECNECGEPINVKRPFVLWSVVKEHKGEEEVIDDIAAFHLSCFELVAEDLTERAMEDEEEEDDGELGPEDAEEFIHGMGEMFKKIMDDFEDVKNTYRYAGMGGAEGRRIPHGPSEDTGMTPEEAYKVLKIPPNSPDDVIKAAWRKRSKETHPDLNKGKDTTEEFKKVRIAYETLKGE